MVERLVARREREAEAMKEAASGHGHGDDGGAEVVSPETMARMLNRE